MSRSEQVVLHTEDGLRLAGHWRQCVGGGVGDAGTATSPIATVVVVHGFSASQEDAKVAGMAEELQRAGYDVLLYDARGHGASGGLSTVGSAEHLDVASAVAHAVARDATSDVPTVLLGVSMGAIAVVRYLAAPPASTQVAGAVLVSGPARWQMRASPVGVLAALLTRTRPGRWVAARQLGVRVAPGLRAGETPESMMARVAVPVAVVHGEGDRLLASTHGQRLYRSAAGPVKLDVVVGMGHGLDERSRGAVLGAVQWVLGAPTRAPSVKLPVPAA